MKTWYDKNYKDVSDRISFYGVPSVITSGPTRIRCFPKIKNVIFNDPATIVFWSDNTKTVVKCYGEGFDPEKGIAMAYAKKAADMDGEDGYYRQIKKWADKYWEQETEFESRFNKILSDLFSSGLATFIDATSNTPDASD